MRDLKLLLAAFLGIFFVFSPVANNFLLVEKILPAPGITSKPLPSIKEKTMVGQQAPNLKMVCLDGKEVELEDFKGKTMVLYFWSTWCPTCWKGMWFMNDLHIKNNNSNQVIILAVNIGFRDCQSKIERFMKRRDLKLPVTICSTDAMSQFNISGIPVAFIIDDQGIIHCEEMGPIEGKGFREKLKKILDEQNQFPK